MAIHKNSAGRGIHQPGQYQVTNNSGATITKGKVVKVTGMASFITVEVVSNPTTDYILGVVVDDIDDGENGHVARMGLFGQFDTSGFTNQAILYSDGNGDLTTSVLGPQIGTVMSVSGSNGHILFDVTDTASGGGSDGHNVLVTTLTQTDVDNGFINLPVSPSTPSATLVELSGAGNQTYGDDFTVSGNTITFLSVNPGDLGNLISAGDKLTLLYKQEQL